MDAFFVKIEIHPRLNTGVLLLQLDRPNRRSIVKGQQERNKI